MVNRKTKPGATLDPMGLALAEARQAGERGEVPVGAVIVSTDGAVLAQAGNATRALNDPTAHAEILAIRAACDVIASERLTGFDLYVTLEPCAMCAAAISFARHPPPVLCRARPQGRRRRARPPLLRPAHLPPSPRGHRWSARERGGNAAQGFLCRAAVMKTLTTPSRRPPRAAAWSPPWRVRSLPEYP